MQTSSFWFIRSVTVLLLASCSGSEFQSTGKGLPSTADGGNVAGSTSSTGGSKATGGRGNGGITSSGGNPNSGGSSGALGTGGSVGGGGVTGSPGDSGVGGNGMGNGGVTTNTGGSVGMGGAVVCTDQTTFYPDADKDTFGRSTGTVVGCSPPPTGNWALVGGDCDDDNENVHPQQSNYFEVARSTSGGNHSFDYDCSGAEEGDPSQLGAAPACNAPLGIGCTGAGYVPTTRSGPGVNPLCGSMTQSTCKPGTLTCMSVRMDVSVAYRCK